MARIYSDCSTCRVIVIELFECCLWRHGRDTYVDRDPLETRNDRNDRAIRSAVSWYQSHFAENDLDGMKVVLLTNDKAHLDKSFGQGIIVYTGTADNMSLGVFST